jgi:hypothetical protein
MAFIDAKRGFLQKLRPISRSGNEAERFSSDAEWLHMTAGRRRTEA